MLAFLFTDKYTFLVYNISVEVEVTLSKKAEKDLRKIPRNISILFDLWVQTIEEDGYEAMKKRRGYRDHKLIGDRAGQRSSSLSRSYRVIYDLNENFEVLIIEVLEVNKHEYKK